MTHVTDRHSILYQLLIDKKYRILRHTVLFIFILGIALNYATPPNNPEMYSSPVFFCYVLSLMLTYLIPTYLNLYYLIPRYLFNKRYLGYFTFLTVLIAIILFIQFISEDIAYSLMGIQPIASYNFGNTLVFILDLFGNYILNFIAFTGCSVTLLLRHWIKDNERVGQLEGEHLQTQVEHLKQQIAPGFLFKTLNLIARTGETDTTEASGALMKFSKLLRYQLYDSNRSEVFLTSEIQFLNDYLNLEQLHYKRLKYAITTDGDVSYVLVAPMLFMPFVKYMVDGIANADMYCNISISFRGDEENGNIVFTCIGDVRPGNRKNVFNDIRQRLDLLYGNSYTLQQQPPSYIIPEGQKIILTLNLY